MRAMQPTACAPQACRCLCLQAALFKQQLAARSHDVRGMHAAACMAQAMHGMLCRKNQVPSTHPALRGYTHLQQSKQVLLDLVQTAEQDPRHTKSSSKHIHTRVATSPPQKSSALACHKSTLIDQEATNTDHPEHSLANCKEPSFMSTTKCVRQHRCWQQYVANSSVVRVAVHTLQQLHRRTERETAGCVCMSCRGKQEGEMYKPLACIRKQGLCQQLLFSVIRRGCQHANQGCRALARCMALESVCYALLHMHVHT